MKRRPAAPRQAETRSTDPAQGNEMTNRDMVMVDGASASDASPAASFLEEVKASLAGTVPDCRCRHTVEETLDRIAQRRRSHWRGAALREARERRRTIICLVDLLAELDDITESEPDLSAFHEAAALFEDIAAAAAAGAQAARRAGSADLPRRVKDPG